MKLTEHNMLGFVGQIAFAVAGAAIIATVVSGCGGSEGTATALVAQGSSPSHAGSQAAVSPASSSDVVKPMSGSYLGDMDGDGDATVGDAIIILRFVVGLDLPTSYESWLANVDGSYDPAIDIGDAIMVLQAVVNPQLWPLPWPGGGGPPPPPF